MQPMIVPARPEDRDSNQAGATATTVRPPSRFHELPRRRLGGIDDRYKVSVIVPNYNHARFLDERLRGIFSQTYRPHEIIFLDDCSNDGSVAVARRLASESPVPFHLVINQANSGSTFRQWLKGLDRATGDLVWIAESDDSCRPELLERLVPEFFDPTVALAYVQSASIGSDGRGLTNDYLAWTDDVSRTHWRRPYRVPGVAEVELALSQKNSIPNASAVLFRKREIDCRADLETIRLAGDWLFYAMQIRDGKISFFPDVLNFHRQHDHTVRNAIGRSTEYFVEQLFVKARIFESFPVSPNAISLSMGRTIQDYGLSVAGHGAHRPSLTGQPEFGPLLERTRAAFTNRLRPARERRILVVVDGIDGDTGPAEANSLSRRFQVFLCNARPWRLDRETAALVDERIVLLEGTLGVSPWAGERPIDLDGSASEAVSPDRAEIIGELIHLHRIDEIHSRGPWADRLVAALNLDPPIPWFPTANVTTVGGTGDQDRR